MAGQLQALTEAIYDAALDPAGWPPAVALLQQRFRSTAEAFYFHDDARQQIYPLHRGGITEPFVRTYAEMAGLPDYPWRRALPLREPGVLRTEARLVAFTGDGEAMRRSAYFNEWLRPQRLEHSIGITLLAEAGLTAKFTLLRPAEAGAFRAAEEREFKALSGALRRALVFSRRLALQAERAEAGAAALDRLGWGIAVLALDGRLLHANTVAEALLRAGDGLGLRDGRPTAADHRDSARLDRFLRAAAEPDAPGPDSIALRRQGRPPLTLSAMRLSGGARAFAAGGPPILLLIADPAARRPAGGVRLRELYGLTPAETRLAEALLGGASLRQAADGAGITYETARWHLKALFQKTDTNRQAELIARLSRDLAATPLD